MSTCFSGPNDLSLNCLTMSWSCFDISDDNDFTVLDVLYMLIYLHCLKPIFVLCCLHTPTFKCQYTENTHKLNKHNVILIPYKIISQYCNTVFIPWYCISSLIVYLFTVSSYFWVKQLCYLTEITCDKFWIYSEIPEFELIYSVGLTVTLHSSGGDRNTIKVE